MKLVLLAGPTLPVPMPRSVVSAIESVEVTHDGEGRSAFQVSLRIQRSGIAGLLAESLMELPLLEVGIRVVLVLELGGTPRVLIDGIITHQQQKPLHKSHESLLTLSGEDLTVLMDREERTVEHPAQVESVIAAKLIAGYARYGIIPTVIPPAFFNPPSPTDHIPVQHGTDYAYLVELARRHDYVFHLDFGPAPLTSRAYWGPALQLGVPQKALSVDMGADSDVLSIDFEHDADVPRKLEGKLSDRSTNQEFSVRSLLSLRPPLASMPTLVTKSGLVKKEKLRADGMTIPEALAKANAASSRSTDSVLTGKGEVDTAAYGDVIVPRGLIGVRGAGLLYDGFYHVRSVTHTLRPGEYRQAFTISREGLGTTTPVVRA